ncbi:MAG: phosphoadenosine phosphosulfate reductase family protein [Clostridiales bacterium]|nr:phosphoadenosine phosphosulfate reductase family protein [Clostridiales bacterium]
MNIILDYTLDFENEVIMAYELGGKYELKNYAKYWMSDIYEFAQSQSSDKETDPLCIHFYNKKGYIDVEDIVDQIYDRLKNFKLFAYYYDVCQEHMRDVVKTMKYSPVSYLSEEPTLYEDQIDEVNSLYDIDDCLPLPLSSHNLFSYVEEQFTPDMLEYEALRKSLNEVNKVLPLEYAFVSSKDFVKSITKLLSDFSMPTDKNVNIKQISTIDKDYVILQYYMNGIEDMRQVRKLMYFNIYEVDYNGLSMIEVLRQFLGDVIFKIVGKAKAKGSDEEAIYGDYPMKDLDFHGLKLCLPSYMHERELELFELQSLNIIKESLLLPGKPVVSSSYGVDSVLVQKLVSKVYPSIDTYHGRTGLNFPEVYDVERRLISEGTIDGSRVYYGKYKKSFWSLVDDFGFNFSRKGDRRENAVGRKVSVSEMCCNLVKHIPFKEAVEHNNWNINFAGLRADESRARDLAAKRDGPIYHASSWNLFRVNPIIFWTDSHVWKYTRGNDVPYASIYDMILYDDNGKELYKPRIGCYSCLLSAKYGYLKWLKKFKPKLYRHLLIDRGLLKLLYAKKFGLDVEVNENGKEYVEDIGDMDVDQVFDFIENRPCFFDDTLATL